ncbi:biotin/lipoyl-containing protein [Oceanobacillus halophilus]|nr:biotin/lipoyl-containing protein [Oceanobacillus halophilus]
MVRDNWKVTGDGLWIAKTMKGCRIGFTPKVVAKMGNIRFMELLTIGEIEEGEPLLIVETLKAVHEISVPISGEIVSINKKVFESPELLTDQAWIIQMTNVKDMEYQKLPDYKQVEWQIG